MHIIKDIWTIVVKHCDILTMVNVSRTCTTLHRMFSCDVERWKNALSQEQCERYVEKDKRCGDLLLVTFAECGDLPLVQFFMKRVKYGTDDLRYALYEAVLHQHKAIVDYMLNVLYGNVSTNLETLSAKLLSMVTSDTQDWQLYLYIKGLLT